jgi:hypothetical protein
MRTYPRDEAIGFLQAWAREDTYFTLGHERALLGGAGFASTVRWRHKSFAVIAAERRATSKTVDRDHKHRPSRAAAEK